MNNPTMKPIKPMKQNDEVQTGPRSKEPFIGFALVALAIFAAIWGILQGFLGSHAEWIGNAPHVPFWMMIGTTGVLLNYLPIASSKPPFIPVLGIVVTIATTGWFIFDNFVDIEGLGEFFGRFKLGLLLMIVCYCLTHMSLMMLTYRKGRQGNVLLIATLVAIGLSGIGYTFLFCGIGSAEVFVTSFMGVIVLFFMKFALTIATVVVALQSKAD